MASDIGRALKRALSEGVVDMASSIAFFAAFSLFPFLLAVIAVAGHVIASTEAQVRLYEVIAEAFPGSADLLRASLESVVRTRGAMGLAAIVGLLWSSSAAFRAVGRAVRQVHGVPPRGHLVRARVRSLSIALLVSLLLVLYMALTSAVEIVFRGDALTTHLGVAEETYTTWKTRVASLLLTFPLVALLYKGSLSMRTPWRDILPGALLATLAIEIGKVAFMAYVDHVGDFETVFGSLSSIMLLLLWLYVSAIALVVGAAYNVVRLERLGRL